VSEVSPREMQREPQPPYGGQHREQEPAVGRAVRECERDLCDHDESGAPEDVDDRSVADRDAHPPERRRQPEDYGEVEKQDAAEAQPGTVGATSLRARRRPRSVCGRASCAATHTSAAAHASSSPRDPGCHWGSQPALCARSARGLSGPQERRATCRRSVAGHRTRRGPSRPRPRRGRHREPEGSARTVRAETGLEPGWSSSESDRVRRPGSARRFSVPAPGSATRANVSRLGPPGR